MITINHEPDGYAWTEGTGHHSASAYAVGFYPANYSVPAVASTTMVACLSNHPMEYFQFAWDGRWMDTVGEMWRYR